MTSVLVVGDIMRDVLVLADGPLRRDTDTSAEIELQFGGSAANTAMWLGHLGHPVRFCGRLGVADVVAYQHFASGHGVETYLQEDTDHHTGTIVVLIDGETRSMLTDRGANLALSVQDIPSSVIREATLLHLTGYTFFHAVDPAPWCDLMDQVRAQGGRVILDTSSAGFLADYGAERWWQVATHTSILRANQEEAELLTGEDEPLRQAAALSTRGMMAIVTCGGRGAVWCEPGGSPVQLPATPLGPEGVVDPTGAGDSFSAGLIAGLCEGLSGDEAIRRGLDLSALVVSRPGAGPS